MNNFIIINKAEQDVAKAKEHLYVLKQKITDSKTKLEEAKADYEANVNSSCTDNSGLHELTLSVDLIKVELKKTEDSLTTLNNDLENSKEQSKKAELCNMRSLQRWVLVSTPSASGFVRS